MTQDDIISLLNEAIQVLEKDGKLSHNARKTLQNARQVCLDHEAQLNLLPVYWQDFSARVGLACCESGLMSNGRNRLLLAFDRFLRGKTIGDEKEMILGFFRELRKQLDDPFVLKVELRSFAISSGQTMGLVL